METTPESPNIFDYLCYRSFLREKFEALGAKNKKYSQRWLAQRAGLKSPQLISMVLSGQRKLSLANARLLSYALGLDEKEERYFLMIVELAEIQNAEERDELLSRIKAEFKDGLFAKINGLRAELLKHWYLPPLRELVVISGQDQSPRSLAFMLNLTEEQVTEGLAILERHSFIGKDEKGRYTKQEPSVRADDYVAPLMMAQYHLQAIDRSSRAMVLPRSKRHFEALTIALPSHLVTECVEKIKCLIRELDMLAETCPRKSEVYQLNIQFFSVLQEALCDDKKA